MGWIVLTGSVNLALVFAAPESARAQAVPPPFPRLYVLGAAGRAYGLDNRYYDAVVAVHSGRGAAGVSTWTIAAGPGIIRARSRAFFG